MLRNGWCNIPSEILHSNAMCSRMFRSTSKFKAMAQRGGATNTLLHAISDIQNSKAKWKVTLAANSTAVKKFQPIILTSCQMGFRNWSIAFCHVTYVRTCVRPIIWSSWRRHFAKNHVVLRDVSLKYGLRHLIWIHFILSNPKNLWWVQRVSMSFLIFATGGIVTQIICVAKVRGETYAKWSCERINKQFCHSWLHQYRFFLFSWAAMAFTAKLARGSSFCLIMQQDLGKWDLAPLAGNVRLLRL